MVQLEHRPKAHLDSAVRGSGARGGVQRRSRRKIELEKVRKEAFADSSAAVATRESFFFSFSRSRRKYPEMPSHVFHGTVKRPNANASTDPKAFRHKSTAQHASKDEPNPRKHRKNPKSNDSAHKIEIDEAHVPCNQQTGHFSKDKILWGICQLSESNHKLASAKVLDWRTKQKSRKGNKQAACNRV